MGTLRKPTIGEFKRGFKYLVRFMDVKNWTDAKEYIFPEVPYNAMDKDPITYLENYIEKDRIRTKE